MAARREPLQTAAVTSGATMIPDYIRALADAHTERRRKGATTKLRDMRPALQELASRLEGGDERLLRQVLEALPLVLGRAEQRPSPGASPSEAEP